MKRNIFLWLLLSASLCSTAQLHVRPEHALMVTNDYEIQDRVYKIRPTIDVPVTVAGSAWTIYAFTKIYNKPPSNSEQIAALNKNDINRFDRRAVDVYSEKAANASNVFFYAAMPLPLLLLADKNIRNDFGQVGLLYLEAMAITGTLYSSATTFVDRYRPYAYNPEVPMDVRQHGGAKNSFFAGHVALVGTSTFFAAKVFSDYHPTSTLRPYLWTAAALVTGSTAYLQYRGGHHFPSDILLGTAVGTLSGILVPQFHKVKLIKNENLTVVPFMGKSNGLEIVYRM